jgi:hypothetical protein
MIKKLEMRSKIAKFSPEFWRRKVGEKLLFLLNTTYSFQNIWKKKEHALITNVTFYREKYSRRKVLQK